MKLRDLLKEGPTGPVGPDDDPMKNNNAQPTAKPNQKPDGGKTPSNSGESDAAQKAHHLGLVAKPYGNWADPNSGQIVAKTIQGQLVKTTAQDRRANDVPTVGPSDTQQLVPQQRPDWAKTPSSQDAFAPPTEDDYKQLYGQNYQKMMPKLGDLKPKAPSPEPQEPTNPTEDDYKHFGPDESVDLRPMMVRLRIT